MDVVRRKFPDLQDFADDLYVDGATTGKPSITLWTLHGQQRRRKALFHQPDGGNFVCAYASDTRCLSQLSSLNHVEAPSINVPCFTMPFSLIYLIPVVF